MGILRTEYCGMAQIHFKAHLSFIFGIKKMCTNLLYKLKDRVRHTYTLNNV